MTPHVAVTALLGLVAAALLVAAHHLVAQHRLILGRLAALERDSARALPGESASQRRARLFGRFDAGDDFTADNIVRAVANNDEYGLRDEPLAADDVVVDVGAHVGTFSFLCHILGSRAIHAFEPWPANFAALRRNLGALPGVQLAPLAVWRSDGGGAPAWLTLSGPDGENSGACSALTGGGPLPFGTPATAPPAGAPRRAGSVALDVVLERLGRVRLLKLDCEGSEFPILLTATQLHRVTRIVAEVHEVFEDGMRLLAPESRVSGHDAYRVGALVARLEGAGFRVATQRTGPAQLLLDARRAPEATPA